MHKTLDLISEKRNDKNCKLQKIDIEDGKKNIIFLDIDGMIQPYDQRERFDHDLGNYRAVSARDAGKVNSRENLRANLRANSKIYPIEWT